MNRCVDLEWQGDPPEFYCPVCGKAIVTLKGPSDERCGHVKFLYVYEAGDFEFITEDYSSLLENYDDESDDDIIEFLINKTESKSLVALNLTTHGIDCGPVSFTVCFGVDFDPQK